jgi:dTDP-4-dehydrorhamnose reductase
MILILGGQGMLGRELASFLHLTGIPLYIADKKTIDITDFKNESRKIINAPIDMIINCASYTNVNKAQEERALAHEINAKALEAVCDYCNQRSIKLIHFSTDYVFSGFKNDAYDEEDDCNPRNYYGKSKLGGESIVRNCSDDYKILRLQWLYGTGGKNFIDKIHSKVCFREPISVVVDQFGSPCSTSFVSKIVYNMIVNWSKIDSGVYHLTHDNHCSWMNLAKYFLKKIGFSYELSPMLSYELENITKVMRPRSTILSNKKLKEALGLDDLGTWEEDLDNYLQKNKFKFGGNL